jgi:hypothetical protein
MRYIMILMTVLFANRVYAHEMTPAYPKLEQSIMDDVLKATVVLFNRRSDVSYYQVSVFDQEWEPMIFATSSNIVRLEYLSKKTIEIYIRSEDAIRSGYICTQSKILKGEANAVVSSRICSKMVRE